MVQQRDTVALAVPESGGVRRDVLGDHTRVFEDVVNDLGGDLGDLIRIDVVGEKVAEHPAGTSRGEPVEKDSIPLGDKATMEAYIGALGLAAHRQGELLDVTSKIADTVQGRRRAVGNQRNARVIEASPRRPPWIELEPHGA